MRRGNVYYADFGQGMGCEQSGRRPCVIIQNNVGNNYSPTVIVAPMTTRTKKQMPTHVSVSDKDTSAVKGSIILLEQIRTIDKDRLKEFVGNLSAETMRKVDEAIHISLALNKEERGEETDLNELRIFEKEDFGSIRTIMIEDEPWFVANDIAKALGYRMASDLTRRIDNEDKGTHLVSTPSGEQNMTVINESGLYESILGSKIPTAKKFKRWVTNEVLPSIRKHGMYAADELINNPDLLIAVATQLKEEREKNRRLEEQKQALEQETIEMDKKISELTPKANYVDVILKSKSTVLVTQIAQDYGMSAKAFNMKLKEFGIQHKVGGQWILYGKYQGQGYVHSQTIDITRSNGQADVVMQTEWTQKGRLFLYDELKKHEIYPMIERVK